MSARGVSVTLVMMVVALIAAGALGLFFIRTFIGAINLVGDILPINYSDQLGQSYQNQVEPALFTYAHSQRFSGDPRNRRIN